MCADSLTPPAEIGPHLRVNARDGLGDGDWLETGEHVLDECASPRSLCTSGAMDAVQQLADRDHADGAFFIAYERLECGGGFGPLPIDQEGGIDQDGQGPSGTWPASLRIRRASLAKSSSTGGAVARSSLKRAAETRRARGVVITATGAPARVTSISSPCAMRFSTSEKLRATSVAVRRTMLAEYPINLIYAIRRRSAR